MSWYIKQIGTRAAVKAQVLASSQIPSTIKSVITDIIDDPNPLAPNGVRVEGSGHQGGGSWNTINQLVVEPIALTI